ncbi:MAG: marine proteobacterial sortase target protein [Arenicella sp.]
MAISKIYTKNHRFAYLTHQHFKKIFGTCINVFFIITAFIFFNTGFANSGISHSEVTNNETSAGELLLKTDNGIPVNALLLKTDIQADVNGLIATINMKQKFKNDSDSWVNGRYVFPLPENGAVDGMTLQIGDRIITGNIKEKEAAKKTFEAAKKSGKKASLLEQHRPNLFSISVANIPPHSEVIANIRIIDRVKYEQQRFSLRLPTTLTPRYTPGKALKLNIEENENVQINQHSGWGVNTDLVPDAESITPPQTHVESGQATHRFSLQLNLNAGIKLQRIHSESHELSTQKISKSMTSIQLQNTTEKMDRDLVIQWHPISTQAPTAALFQQHINGEQYSMAMLLPPTANIQNALPREITFIIDSSGSMAGDSMAKAKSSLLFALNQLTSNDKFNVIDFDSSYTPLFKQPQNANQRNISQAKSMVNGLQANGGTEMYGPLEYALNSPSHDNYLKQIIFITDGSVGNEQQLFKLINDKLNSARLFTVGIGTAPNSHFMTRAAQFGRGTFTYIDTHGENTEKMNDLFNKINKPIARDITVQYNSHSNTNESTLPESITVEQYPNKIPDLYAGEPLVILTKSNHIINSIDISGNLLGNAWNRKLHTPTKHSLSNHQNNTDNIDALWARKKVAHLMDQLYTGSSTEATVKPIIIGLGIKHHLVTKFTSFVAVEKTPSKPKYATANNKHVSNLMPKGNKMVAPQTATSAGLLSFIGSLIMLFAMLIGNQRFRNLLLGKEIEDSASPTQNHKHQEHDEARNDYSA